MTKPTSFRFNVQDEMKDERFEWLGHDLFKPGNNVSIHMGYAGNMQKMLDGKIQNISASFSEGSTLSFVVDGADAGYQLLNVASGPRIFRNKKDSDIAREIADLASLKADVEDTETIFSTKTKDGGKSYFEFLLDLVQSNPGYTFYLSEKTLHFTTKKQKQDSGLTLKLGAELTRFNPTLNTRKVVSEVIVRGWDRINKKKIEVSVKAGEETTQEKTKQSASKVAQNIYGEVVKTITDRPINSG